MRLLTKTIQKSLFLLLICFLSFSSTISSPTFISKLISGTCPEGTASDTWTCVISYNINDIPISIFGVSCNGAAWNKNFQYPSKIVILDSNAIAMAYLTSPKSLQVSSSIPAKVHIISLITGDSATKDIILKNENNLKLQNENNLETSIDISSLPQGYYGVLFNSLNSEFPFKLITFIKF